MKKQLSRRRFLRIASLGAAGGMAFPGGLRSFADASDRGEGRDLKSLFIANREDALALTDDVFQKCILEKIRPPQPPLEHNWIWPGGPYYQGQWIWDSMFVVDLLSILPGKQQVIRDIFQNYWDFQDRWNQEMPPYAHDMVTVAIKTEPQEVRRFSQIPILAWGVERVFMRNGDRKLLSQCLPRLERFHDWYWRERDVADVGHQTMEFDVARAQRAPYIPQQ